MKMGPDNMVRPDTSFRPAQRVPAPGQTSPSFVYPTLVVEVADSETFSHAHEKAQLYLQYTYSGPTYSRNQALGTTPKQLLCNRRVHGVLFESFSMPFSVGRPFWKGTSMFLFMSFSVALFTKRCATDIDSIAAQGLDCGLGPKVVSGEQYLGYNGLSGPYPPAMQSILQSTV